MKRLVVLVFSLIFIQPVFAQWQMLNSPLATPEIKLVASHPDGNVFAISNLNEVFRKDTTSNDWDKISVLDSVANCISISPDGIIYIGTTGGYFYSLDYGYNWIAKTVLAPNNFDHYISDFEFGINGYIHLTSFAYGASGVWISSDNGISWNKYTSGLSANSLVGLETDSIDNLYVLNSNGSIFKSTDHGLNWEQKYSFQTTSFSIEIDNSNNLYVSTNSGIYKSSDFGSNWSQVFNGNNGVKKIFANNNDIFAIRGGYYGIIHSTDAGTNWVNIGLVGYFIYDLISVNNTIYSGTKKGLRLSTDFGNDWTLSFKYDDIFVKVNDVIIINDKIFVSSNQGVFISTNNGVNWLQTSLTENTRMVRNDLFGNLYAASDSLYKSTNSGEYWFKTNVSYAPVVKMFINDSGHIFIGEGDCCNCEIVVQRSIKHGNTWNYVFSIQGVWDICEKVYELVESTSGNLFLSYREWGLIHPGNI